MKSFFGAVTLSSENVVIFGHLRMWAENGLIHIEDSRDSSYEAISVRTALHRMKGISDMLGNSTDRDKYSESQFDQKWRKENQEMIDHMVRLIQKAREQGTPDDASASRDLVRRRRKVVLVPGLQSSM